MKKIALSLLFLVIFINVFALPPAQDDTFTVLVNGTLSGNVTLNDSLTGSNSTVKILMQPMHGSLTFNPNGSFVYKPDSAFVGNDVFVYELCDASNNCSKGTVSINVDSPRTVGPTSGIQDDDFTVMSGDTLSANVIDNDSVGVVRAVGLLVSPLNGQLSFATNGTFRYIPNAGYSGSDTFVYEVCNTAGICAKGTVNISIKPIVNTGVVTVNTLLDTYFSTDTNEVINASIFSATDSTLTVNLLQKPTNGNINMNPDGSFTYTPNTGFVGQDTFVYEVCDAKNVCNKASGIVTVGEKVTIIPNPQPLPEVLPTVDAAPTKNATDCPPICVPVTLKIVK